MTRARWALLGVVVGMALGLFALAFCALLDADREAQQSGWVR